MVFFYIFYLLLISFFCLPFSFRAKIHLGDRLEPYFVNLNINRLIDIFPFSKGESKIKQIAKKSKYAFKLKTLPTSDILKILTVYELKILCHNISKYSNIAYNMALALLQQFVTMLRIYDNLYDFDFITTESSDNMPKIQLKLHVKVNLFIIFSRFFKIIKITKKGASYEN
ncbi:MAG: hypothetical protein GX242_06400 [Clostridiales bacterium]|nr:hypothetical protein [Clostridiales bacterium]